MKKLSVIMSTFNDEATIGLSIDSILNQTFSDFDFLIIDDNSSDKTRIILRDYEKKDQRIKLFFNAHNKGLGENLKFGVEISQTPWFARMDADDIAHPKRLETQMDYLEKNPEIDILGSWAIDINNQNQKMRIRKVPILDVDIKRLIWTCPVLHPTVVCRRESILTIGNYNPLLRKCQDYDLWFRCALFDLKFHNLPQELMFYRHDLSRHQRFNFKVGLIKLKVGLKGVINNKLGVVAFFGVFFPFFKAVLPRVLRVYIQKLQTILDPRLKF